LAKLSHAEILESFREQLAEILDNSDQAVYLYLDEINKVCNQKFASLLGYKSADEWAAVRAGFAETFVTPKDRPVLVTAYQNAMNKLVGSAISVRWKKKNGGEVPTKTILVPVVFEGHKMALHFISPA
jgi:carbohydrate-binding DOMON domain-containing protein